MFRPCIVVPIFNHGREIQRFLPDITPAEIPVILVDDASEATTAEILDDLVSHYSDVTVFRHNRNQGKGAAVTTGIRAAREAGFTHVLQIDADGQHDPRDIPGFFKLSERNPDAVITGRPIYDDDVPQLRYYARYLTHIWIWVETLSLDIRDSMCGFRVYPVEPVLNLIDRNVRGRRMDFDPELLVRLHWDNVPILSYETTVKYDPGGLSNFRLFWDNALISWMHTRLVFGMLVRLPWLLNRRFTQVKE